MGTRRSSTSLTRSQVRPSQAICAVWLIQSVDAAVEPTAPQPFVNTGNVLRIGASGRPAKIEASRSYRTALRLQPRNYDVLTSLAWLDFSLVRIRVPY